MPCPEQVTFCISEEGDEGWAASVQTPTQGDLYLNTSNEAGDVAGFHTADEAIMAVKKWCVSRGYHEPTVDFVVTANRCDPEWITPCD